jgi:hypothetical protein
MGWGAAGAAVVAVVAVVVAVVVAAVTVAALGGAAAGCLEGAAKVWVPAAGCSIGTAGTQPSSRQRGHREPQWRSASIRQDAWKPCPQGCSLRHASSGATSVAGPRQMGQASSTKAAAAAARASLSPPSSRVPPLVAHTAAGGGLRGAKGTERRPSFCRVGIGARAEGWRWREG